MGGDRASSTTGYDAANLRATDAPVPGPTPAMIAIGVAIGEEDLVRAEKSWGERRMGVVDGGRRERRDGEMDYKATCWVLALVCGLLISRYSDRVTVPRER